MCVTSCLMSMTFGHKTWEPMRLLLTSIRYKIKTKVLTIYLFLLNIEIILFFLFIYIQGRIMSEMTFVMLLYIIVIGHVIVLYLIFFLCEHTQMNCPQKDNMS